MKTKKALALFLVLAILASLVQGITVFSQNSASQSNDKGWRLVGIHAQEGDSISPERPSTIYMNEDANIYLAIDKPNKGAVSATGKRLEEHYDLNGYTVKFYYDDEYFNLNAPDNTKPVNYMVPGEYDDTMIEMNGVMVPGNSVIGYMPHENRAVTVNLPDKGNKKYQVAYATVLFRGSWLPDKDVDWYNLCALPIRPEKTGTTEVFIEVGTADEHALELYSKNKPGEEQKNFEMTVVGGGVHTIIIEEQKKPSPPTVTPLSGTYPEKQTITIGEVEGCDVYYSINGGAEELYTTPFEITENTTLVCYTKKKTGDRRESEKVTYNYVISAKRPYLFKADKTTLVPDIYDSETSAYKVYFSDTDEEYTAEIPTETKIYYTFKEDIKQTNPVQTSDSAENGWVVVDRNLRELTIDRARTIRMFTDKKGVLSEIATYYLGVSPGEVVASKPSDVYNRNLEITLSTNTPNAEIYYTVDGTSPLEETANKYDPALSVVISDDTTLKAVAKVDGKFGPVMTNWYIIDISDDYGVRAVYPSGTYESMVEVSLLPSNPEYSVEYKDEGDENWKPYEKTLKIEDDTTIIARARDKSGNLGTTEYTFKYIIIPKAPVFSHPSTQFSGTNNVMVYCEETTVENTERYTLYYTVDGTSPVTYQSGIPSISQSSSVKKADAVSDLVKLPISKYTVVKAVVVKDGKRFSAVVQNTYDVAKQKPVIPVPTLTPGSYIREIETDQSFDFATLFMKVSEKEEIFYTVSDYNGLFCPDPVPNTTIDGTKYYDKNNPQPIIIKGKTIIKAVVVNDKGIKSDVGVYEYTIIPESPIAAPSAVLGGNVLPVVPVSAVKGSTVHYTVGGFSNSFYCDMDEFYIDMTTGTAYSDPDDPTSILGDRGTASNTDTATLKIWCEKRGIASEPNYYVYRLGDDGIAAPYANQPTAKRMERYLDQNKTLMQIVLRSLNNGGNIEYKLNDDENWTPYVVGSTIDIRPGNIDENGDVRLQARSVVNGEYSETVYYKYMFYPVQPVITLDGGTYVPSPTPTTRIKLLNSFYGLLENYDRVQNKIIDGDYSQYDIHYISGGQSGKLLWNNDVDIPIRQSMTLLAYVRNVNTGRCSSYVSERYWLGTGVLSGDVVMEDPYYGKTRIASQLVTQNPWNKGIKLGTNNVDPDVRIEYKYTRTLVDGTIEQTNTIVYDSASPISITADTKSIEIEAWLANDAGMITNSKFVFDKIEFISIDPPKTSLEDENKIVFNKGKAYTIKNDYAGNDNFTIFYTTNGDDPVEYELQTNQPVINGEKYEPGKELQLLQDTTVKTVYRSTCGKCGYCDAREYDFCLQPVFGKIGFYRYAVNSSPGGGGGSGGGGGGGSATAKRQYTKDVFGQEHPTHIGYINGYPDGSVKPDGNITREETAVILYRIRNKQYEKPFEISGEIFSDVKAERWSVKEIEYMTIEGVINGYPDSEFKPAQNLTRAEFASLICRFSKLDAARKDKSSFSDLEKNHWAYDDIIALYENGLIQGYEDNTFRPDNQITRAEVMTVVNKILGRKPLETYVKTLEFNPFNDLQVEKWYYTAVLEATITHNYYLDKAGFENKWEDCK